jgi:hypothetical protein
MRKAIKTQFKKFKNKLSRSSSPNPPSTPGSQAPSDLAPLAGTNAGIAALAAQGPSSDPRRAILPPQPEPGNTGVPNTESLAPPSDSESAFAMGIPVPTISVQPPSQVYEAISPSDVGDKANVASIGFQGLKTALTMVREAADALKSVAGGLLGLIDIVEVRDFDCFHCHLQHLCLQTTYQNQQDRAELERRIQALVSILKTHQPSSLSSRRLEGLAMFVSIYYCKIIS